MTDKGQAKRGGCRKGAGRKKAPPAPAVLDGRSAAAKTTAGRILEKSRSEKLWLSMIGIECDRLGIDPGTGERIAAVKPGGINEGDYKGNYSVIPLSQMLRYLEDRYHGRPVDTVNHVHDKPLDVNVSFAEVVRGVRLRKQAYEQSRRS